VPSKSNKAFSLLEVIITVAILSSAIVVVLRAFTTIISAAKLSQDITLACFFTEDKLWKLENDFPLQEDGAEENRFTYSYEFLDTNTPKLKELKFNVSWEEKRNSPYSLEFYTYKLVKNNTP